MSLEHAPGAKPLVCIGLKSHPLVVLSQMYFSFKCPNELVPPYLSDYFIRNCTIHTYKTRQSNDIHRPNPKLTLEKKHLDFQVQFFLIIYPRQKKLRRFPFIRNFLAFILAISCFLLI